MKHLCCLILILGAGLAAASSRPADAATITAAYASGYRDVLINDYGTSGLGTFRLRDGGDELLALCLEAHEAHSTADDAYRPVANRIASAELDVLLWMMERTTPIDDDTAIAAAALAWYLADAQRTIGTPVWSNGADGFARITPTAPEHWGELAPFSSGHPVGLRAAGRDLDAAEARVAELHRLALERRGPWTLQADADAAGFRLSGPGGPIPGQQVVIEVEPSGVGGAIVTSTAVTDTDGRVTAALPELPDGGTVRAHADGPGVHREWDGGGAVQRMATATTTDLSAEFRLAPLPRHVEILKRSADPTIAVGGAEFELTDANGSPIGLAVSDAAGRARFAPVSIEAHPEPWTVREVAAPPGLIAVPAAIEVSPAGHRPDRPTVVEVENRPATVPLVVHKQLSEPDIGPADRSGFVFEVTRRSDGWSDELVTGPSSRTDPLPVALGTYDICERSVPGWAVRFVDDGCATVDVTLGLLEAAEPIAIGYRNRVPTPTIDTLASDAGDGDRVVAASGGSVADVVVLDGLTPGTSYRLVGELVTIGGSGVATATGATSTVELVPDGHTATLSLTFDHGPVPVGPLVVIERLYIGDRLVAEHVDLGDPDQTLTVAPPPTTTTTTTATTTTTSTPTTTTTTTQTTVPTTAPATSTSTTSPPPTTGPPTTGPPTTGSPTTGSPTTTPQRTTPPTLPRTGADRAERLLRLGDAGFVVGVALVAISGLLPRRPRRDPGRATAGP